MIIDEAYIEFDYQNSCSGLLAENKNLVILRTLSKAFALAGLRCGFTLADEAVIHNLLKVIAPYPIAEPVAQIAAQSLTNEGVTTMQQQVQWLEAEKALLKNTLQQIPAIKLVGDDKANFILFRCEQKQGLMDHLVSKGILIRDQSKQHNLDNCLRISIGNSEQNQRLLAQIASFFEKQESTL